MSAPDPLSTDLAADARIRAAFRRKLLGWYDRHGRDLLWRQTRDPYQIWISEIMLQQTTVAAVTPFFQRFLERFPNVASLARAPLDNVLEVWQGLGYYSRARNLHRAAQVLVEEYQGRFPEDAEQLMALPGIGRYTAGAILSFAFERPAPILEANTRRLHARLLGLATDPTSKTHQETLWTFAASLPTARTATASIRH